MQIHILTRVFFKKSNPATTMHSQTLFLTTKPREMIKRLEIEHEEMFNFLTEIMECTRDEISITASGMSDFISNLSGYAYMHKDFIGYLIISTITQEKKNEQEIKTGDYVTFKPAATEYFQSRSNLRELQTAKIAWVHSINQTEESATVYISVAGNSSIRNNAYKLPLDYLQKFEHDKL